MSCGHQVRYPPGCGPHEMERVLAEPRVAARLAQQPVINRFYDTPYLGGYSRDGRTIYFDRHFPARGLKVQQAGEDGRKRPYVRLVNLIPFLLVHEHVEKTLIDVLGYKYQAAHEIATEAEHAKVRAKGMSVKDYEAALRPYLKSDELEKLQKVPPDLDLTPYIDTHDTATLNRIRSVMNRADWQRAIQTTQLRGRRAAG